MTQSAQQDKNAAALKAGRKRLRDRTFSFTLTLPKAVFGACFSLFVLVWVFIFGIMLGRGHNPEEMVPELAKVMPAPGSSGAPASPPLSPDAQPQGNMNEVLQPSELKYHDSLKGKDVREKPRAAATPPEAAPTQTGPAPAPPQPAAKAPAPAQPPVASRTSASQDQTVYDYVYQVAAFNSSAGAAAMRKKLQNGGLAAKVDQSESNGTTWYRIMVSFRGKPEDTRGLREQLTAYGLKTPILRGKTPAK